jgi:serine/threonine protein phosphatase PrpC
MMLANCDIHNTSQKKVKFNGMGTTAVVARIDPQNSLIHVYYVGDSRIYRIRDNNIKLLTKDHSKVEELINVGKMRKQDLRKSEMQSIITRSIGTENGVKIDCASYALQEGDIFILCSDGLNSELEDEVIKNVVLFNKKNFSKIPKILIDAAKSAGGRDNITVVSVLVEDVSKEIDVPDLPPIVSTFDDNTVRQKLYENLILRYFNKFFLVHLINLKTAIIFKNKTFSTLIVCFVLVSVSLSFVFIGSRMNIQKQNVWANLENSFSKVQLDIRTPEPNFLKNIFRTNFDKKFIYQNIYHQKNEFSAPITNVKISIESVNTNFRFVGFSGEKPTEVKIPVGSYRIVLSYPEYEILNAEYEICESLNITVDLGDTAQTLTVMMLPQDCVF